MRLARRIHPLLIALALVWGPTAFSAQDLHILIIGDSNTELGPIVNGLNQVLRDQFGDSGSGYVPLNAATMGTILPRVITVTNDNGWKKLDMFNGVRLPRPYRSPDGNWVESTRTGAVTSVAFTGAALDVYWLGQPGGGPILVALDGLDRPPIATASPNLAVHKTRVGAPVSGTHLLTLTAGDGKIALLGADVLADLHRRRVVCHKWGNGWSSTRDFLNIEEPVLTSGLRELAPQVVVLLLGTNDHNIDGSPAPVFQRQLIQLLQRIQNAVPQAAVVLTSTFETKSPGAKALLPQYRATAYPAAAKETGVYYWDMSTWFGPFDQTRMLDPFHCNPKGGLAIATEMFHQITQAQAAKGQPVPAK